MLIFVVLKSLKILIFTPRDSGFTGVVILNGDANVLPILISTMKGSLEEAGGSKTHIPIYFQISTAIGNRKNKSNLTDVYFLSSLSVPKLSRVLPLTSLIPTLLLRVQIGRVT